MEHIVKALYISKSLCHLYKLRVILPDKVKNHIGISYDISKH